MLLVLQRLFLAAENLRRSLRRLAVNWKTFAEILCRCVRDLAVFGRYLNDFH